MAVPNENTKRRYNSWFITLPVVAVSLAFGFWFYRPTRDEIRELQGELELKQASLAEAATLPDRLARALAEIRETREFVRAWRSAAASRNLPVIFGEISRIVSESGAQSTKFQPEPLIAQQFLDRVPLTLACQGTFDQIFRLLCQLERMPQSIWLQDVRLVRRSKDDSAVICELRLEIFTDKSNLADSVD
jgi:Tfp pilus assembly protein PilO